MIGRLKLLANLTIQREIWVHQTYNDLAFSFNETINLLDDHGFFDAIDTIIAPLEQSLDQQEVKAFANDILKYQAPDDPAQQLEDPIWWSLVKRAERVVCLLEETLLL